MMMMIGDAGRKMKKSSKGVGLAGRMLISEGRQGAGLGLLLSFTTWSRWS